MEGIAGPAMPFLVSGNPTHPMRRPDEADAPSIPTIGALTLQIHFLYRKKAIIPMIMAIISNHTPRYPQRQVNSGM